FLGSMSHICDSISALAIAMWARGFALMNLLLANDEERSSMPNAPPVAAGRPVLSWSQMADAWGSQIPVASMRLTRNWVRVTSKVWCTWDSGSTPNRL